MKKTIIISLILIFNHILAQKHLNLDFEHNIAYKKTPKVWWLSTNKGYKINLDEKEKYYGAQSLKIESDNPTSKQFGVFSNTVPIESAICARIEFKGMIKTHSVENGYAGLWLKVYGENKETLGFDNMHNRGLIGYNDWTEVFIKMRIPCNAKKIVFGGLLVGKGKAWFDNFEILINGKQFQDIAPKIIKPTQERIAWLKGQIHPLKSFEPKFKNTADLDILGKLVGNTKVIALGEVSHGSREIFKMKHRIIKYLNQNKDFNIFSIEANLPESYKINEYTLLGKGNPEKLIKGMHFWTWSTQEVLEMVEWMKEQNKTNKKIKFTGFDMQYFNESINELKKVFTGKTELINTLDKLKKTLETLRKKKRKLNSINGSQYEEKASQLLLKIKPQIQSSTFEETEKNWLLQNVRIIEQFLGMTYITRDKFMAENFKWIQQKNPKSKIVIWAHNEHIKKTGHAMGKFLDQSLEKDYLNIGFAFHKGSYTAKGKNGISTYIAQDSYIGTFESIFNALNEPIFLLDLRKIKNSNSEHGQWLKESLEFRTTGAVNIPNEFRKKNLLKDFDMIIFINESSNSRLLH